MAAVNLLMTYRAVLESRRAQIVKGRRNTTKRRPGITRRTHSHIGVTLQTYKTNFMPGQHPRIRRSMRLVTGAAAFQSHGRVLERKGSALIGVALQAAWLIPGECSNHLWTRASMRIMAVYAGHGSLRQPVRVGPLELGPRTSSDSRSIARSLARACQGEVQRLRHELCGTRCKTPALLRVRSESFRRGSIDSDGR